MFSSIFVSLVLKSYKIPENVIIKILSIKNIMI